MAQETDRDVTGKFIEWLHKLEPIYGHVLNGYWRDIGTVDQYMTADQTLIRILGR